MDAISVFMDFLMMRRNTWKNQLSSKVSDEQWIIKLVYYLKFQISALTHQQMSYLNFSNSKACLSCVVFQIFWYISFQMN